MPVDIAASSVSKSPLANALMTVAQMPAKIAMTRTVSQASRGRRGGDGQGGAAAPIAWASRSARTVEGGSERFMRSSGRQTNSVFLHGADARETGAFRGA